MCLGWMNNNTDWWMRGMAPDDQHSPCPSHCGTVAGGTSGIPPQLPVELLELLDVRHREGAARTADIEPLLAKRIAALPSNAMSDCARLIRAEWCP